MIRRKKEGSGHANAPLQCNQLRLVALALSVLVVIASTLSVTKWLLAQTASCGQAKDTTIATTNKTTPTASVVPPTDNRTFDVMIGTAGTVMDSAADVLITFDPGDALKKEPKFESYPFAIADYEGTADFWINDDFPQCGSMNYMHGAELGGHVEELKRWYQEWEGSKCPSPAKKGWDVNNAFRCMFPSKSHVVHGIPVRRLSSFLRERGVVRIHTLQIDAQGSDFSILKDVIENYGENLSIQSLVLECQYYATSRPLYLASNDCQQIKTYLQTKLPKATFREQMNNCAIMEYNLFIEVNQGTQKLILPR